MPKYTEWSERQLEKARNLSERQKLILVTVVSITIVLLVVFVLSAFSRLVL